MNFHYNIFLLAYNFNQICSVVPSPSGHPLPRSLVSPPLLPSSPLPFPLPFLSPLPFPLLSLPLSFLPPSLLPSLHSPLSPVSSIRVLHSRSLHDRWFVGSCVSSRGYTTEENASPSLTVIASGEGQPQGSWLSHCLEASIFNSLEGQKSSAI